jgi:ribosome biogenesis GTPase
MKNLFQLGFTSKLENYVIEHNLEDFEIGRVVAEHKERYVVISTKGTIEAEITGNLRYTAESREDFPAVGDWVALRVHDEVLAIIHEILPRFSILKRLAVGDRSEVQIIATNINVAFLVQALDRDFNLHRLERYLTLCYDSGISPVIVLTKTDLSDASHLQNAELQLTSRFPDVPVFAISNATGEGIEQIRTQIKAGNTYCLLGSSGVGKSSLLNNLAGTTKMNTDAISSSTQKGRHITTHRELVMLQNGGVIIDNPGMREVGMTDVSSGLEIAFDQIKALANKCKFKNCTHSSETGCAVLEALQNGILDEDVFHNYQKLERERQHFESTALDRKRKDKQLGKLLKNYYKHNVKGRR